MGIAGRVLNIVPTTFSVSLNDNVSRQTVSKVAMKNVHILEESIDATLSYPNGEEEITFTLGENSMEYQAIISDGSQYGTSKSTNLTTWSSINNATNNEATSIMWDGTKWIVARTDANDVLYSHDGSHFTNTTSQGTLASIAYNNSLYVGVGVGGIYNSPDGIHWTSVESSILTNTAYAQTGKVIWTGKLWIAAGSGPTYSIAYSSDSINWTGVNSHLDRVVGLSHHSDIIVAIGAHPDGTISSISSDGGITWTLQTGLTVSTLPAFTTFTSTVLSSSSIQYTFAYPAGGATYTLKLNNGGGIYYPNSSPYTVSGLTSATTYVATIVASNGYATSPASTQTATTS